MSKRSSARPDAATSSLSDGDDGALAAESIGQYLSQQRRLRGISVNELAELTRIPVRSIERLEAGHFDRDVDGFVRGFVRTVSAALGVDPEDALARMLAEPRGEPDAGRPLSLLLARSLVGLFAIALVVLAVGLVRSVLDRDAAAPAVLAESPTIWRSDPVRALAEANAAQQRGAPPEAAAKPRGVPPEAVAAKPRGVPSEAVAGKPRE